MSGSAKHSSGGGGDDRKGDFAWFRNTAPYIDAHRGRRFVLMLGGEIFVWTDHYCWLYQCGSDDRHPPPAHRVSLEGVN